MNTIAFDYSGANVLVTGGTSGIGAATAAAYRGAGATVTITGRRADASDYDEDLSGYRYLQLDVEDPASIDRVAAALERLDILINNAGTPLTTQGFDEYEPDIFARSVNMMLIGAYRMAAKSADLLAASDLDGGGSVIGIASMSSFFGLTSVPGYGSAKTGLVGMTRVLAAQWGPRGIRVNAVAPGLTLTRATEGALEDEEWTKLTLDRTPLGRVGTAVDSIGAILFLTSSAASWITGQTLPVDGGFTIAG